MELRHLRCFMAVAKELHFSRAAEALHIDQSPLSRTIKELEEHLGTALFLRTTRSTQLTLAGKLFLENVPRVFNAVEQARSSVKAATAGFSGLLRIALSDGITPSRLSALMALSRKEEPDISIRFYEVPLVQQIRGLHEDLYDAGFAQSADVGDGIRARRAWSEPLHVALPERHPLSVHGCIPLDELLRYPLVMADQQLFEGYYRQVQRVLNMVNQKPLVTDQVKSFDLMMAMVSAGVALALAGASQIAVSRESNIVARPLAGRSPMLTTYLLRQDADATDVLSRFMARVARLEARSSNACDRSASLDPDGQEDSA